MPTLSGFILAISVGYALRVAGPAVIVSPGRHVTGGTSGTGVSGLIPPMVGRFHMLCGAVADPPVPVAEQRRIAQAKP